MKRSRFSEEQIVYAIRQAESGTPIGDLCRQLGVSDATFYTWKKKYAHLGVSELRRLRQVEEENSPVETARWRISRSTSTCCRRPCEKKSKARPPPGTGPVVSRDVSGELCAGLSVGAVRSSLLVSTESGEGSIGASGSAFAIWRMPGLGLATCGSGCCYGVKAGS